MSSDDDNKKKPGQAVPSFAELSHPSFPTLEPEEKTTQISPEMLKQAIAAAKAGAPPPSSSQAPQPARVPLPAPPPRIPTVPAQPAVPPAATRPTEPFVPPLRPATMTDEIQRRPTAPEVVIANRLDGGLEFDFAPTVPSQKPVARAAPASIPPPAMTPIQPPTFDNTPDAPKRSVSRQTLSKPAPPVPDSPATIRGPSPFSATLNEMPRPPAAQPPSDRTAPAQPAFNTNKTALVPPPATAAPAPAFSLNKTVNVPPPQAAPRPAAPTAAEMPAAAEQSVHSAERCARPRRGLPPPRCRKRPSPSPMTRDRRNRGSDARARRPAQPRRTPKTRALARR